MGMLTEAYNSRADEFVAHKQAVETAREKLREIAADLAELNDAYAAAGVPLKIDMNTSGIDGDGYPHLTGTVSGLPRGTGLSLVQDSTVVPFSFVMIGEASRVAAPDCEIILGNRDHPLMGTHGTTVFARLPHWLTEFVKTIETAANVTPEQTVAIAGSLKKGPPPPRSRDQLSM
ncbi:MAG: hypothetical protein ACAH83_17335 [Alphaproteobacteria bacterium]